MRKLPTMGKKKAGTPALTPKSLKPTKRQASIYMKSMVQPVKNGKKSTPVLMKGIPLKYKGK